VSDEAIISQTQAVMSTRDEELSVDQVLSQVRKVQQIMAAVMKKDEHYGIIPGCKKPSLYQPGAQKICFTFRLRPEFDVAESSIDRFGIPPGHIDVSVKCRLVHIPTGNLVAEGVGSCSTLEAKYRYRGEGRKCPECGAEAIIKGKSEYGGGWLCYAKKEGCGAKFPDGDDRIEGQSFGKIENPDIADCYNTVRKMATKRAYIAATLTGTAASDIFTQDVAEEEDETGEPKKANGKAEKPPISMPKAKANGEAKKANTTEGVIEAISKRQGPKGPRYGIKVDGNWYNTFDAKIGEAAVKGQRALLTWEPDGDFRKLKAIEGPAVQEKEEEEQESPAAPDEERPPLTDDDSPF